MSFAFRCDECGEFYEGKSEASRQDRAGKWQVTHSVKEAPKPLHETAKEDEAEKENNLEPEEVDDKVHSSFNTILSYYSSSSYIWGDSRRTPDFCPRCLNSIINSALVLREV